ncbi:MAG: rRNA maturation RNase YbeY [Robiginitomaculum sp.]|nr:MAG: rRNA maturation RNase YbeY [Robiginitomaculum sp.]
MDTPAVREIDIRISDESWPLDKAGAEALVQTVLSAVETQIEPLRDGVLEVWLASDVDLQALNRQYRNKNKPTNVLSFAAPAQPDPVFAAAFGQLALAYGVCAAEAKARNITLVDHVHHLVVHGLLHLQGYDHEMPEEAEEMENHERQIMAALGLHDPYALPGDNHD